jgi:hypothetical protein
VRLVSAVLIPPLMTVARLKIYNTGSATANNMLVTLPLFDRDGSQ